MSGKNLDSKEYDTDAIHNYDPRLEEGRKDTIFLHTLGIVSTIIATIWMYALGTGDPTQMSYFLGFPLWVSGGILVYLVMFAIGMAYIFKWKPMSLAARNSADGKKGE